MNKLADVQDKAEAAWKKSVQILVKGYLSTNTELRP